MANDNVPLPDMVKVLQALLQDDAFESILQRDGVLEIFLKLLPRLRSFIQARKEHGRLLSLALADCSWIQEDGTNFQAGRAQHGIRFPPANSPPTPDDCRPDRSRSHNPPRWNDSRSPTSRSRSPPSPSRDTADPSQSRCSSRTSISGTSCRSRRSRSPRNFRTPSQAALDAVARQMSVWDADPLAFWTQGVEGFQQLSAVQSPQRFRSFLLYAIRERSQLDFQSIHFSFTSVVIFLNFYERFHLKHAQIKRVHEFLQEYSIPGDDAQSCLLLIKAGCRRWNLCSRLPRFQSSVDFSPLFRPEVFSLPSWDAKDNARLIAQYLESTQCQQMTQWLTECRAQVVQAKIIAFARLYLWPRQPQSLSTSITVGAHQPAIARQARPPPQNEAGPRFCHDLLNKEAPQSMPCSGKGDPAGSRGGVPVDQAHLESPHIEDLLGLNTPRGLISGSSRDGRLDDIDMTVDAISSDPSGVGGRRGIRWA